MNGANHEPVWSLLLYSFPQNLAGVRESMCRSTAAESFRSESLIFFVKGSLFSKKMFFGSFGERCDA